MSNDPTDKWLERRIEFRPIKYRTGGTNNKKPQKNNVESPYGPQT